MILFADVLSGGVVTDTERRDKIHAGPQADIFKLLNDAHTDEIHDLADGIDRIDITAFDASWSEMSVRRLSLTEYVVFYQDEERIRVTFETPAPGTFTPTDTLLDETDFIFAPGLPEAVTQLLPERTALEKEVVFGTTRPDVFAFEFDGQRDVVRLFEPGKDRIDLAAYGTDFASLEITERKEGRISIQVPYGDERDHLVLIDISHDLTAADITADMFIF